MPGVFRPGASYIYRAPFGDNDLQSGRIYFEAVQREVCLPSVGARLEECICSDDRENRRLESSRRTTADVSTPLRCAQHDRRFFAVSEMRRATWKWQTGIGGGWRAICNLLLGESAGGNRESSAAEGIRSVLYRLNSSRSRFVWALLTGISVCFLSFMRSW